MCVCHLHLSTQLGRVTVLGQPLLIDNADRLDAIRSHFKLTTIPAASVYFASCRVVHNQEVVGPAQVAGWRPYISGAPGVKNTKDRVFVYSGSNSYSAKITE